MPTLKAIDESGATGFFFLLALFLWLLETPTHAERLRACYPAIAGNIAPIWIAKERGFFAKQGLDVDLTYIRGGTTATAAMLSGEVAFCMIAGAAVIQSQLSGSDLVMRTQRSPLT